jgi:3-dehydroquinate synthase
MVSHAVVITDRNVQTPHAQQVCESLAKVAAKVDVIAVEPGETAKSVAVAASLWEELLRRGADRKTLVIAVGGGVVGDLAGFVAATFARGLRFVQIPTTLLAQVDSSVGGKTAIDTPRGKNLVGAFHQPKLVLADLDVLATLPDREMRAGYAEVIKYGLLGDFAFFEWLEANGPKVLAREPAALAEAVARSVEMKAEIVAEDETEQGRRALLNLGHTFGHALEAETGYGAALLHGEAVAAGMALAFRFSAAQGLCATQEAQRATAGLTAAGLPTTLAEIAGHPFDAGRLVRHMAQDKKAQDGRLTFILARGLGQAFVAGDVDAAAVTDFLKQEGAA